MKAGVFAFTRKGARLSLVISDILMKAGYAVDCFTAEAYTAESDELKTLKPNLSLQVEGIFASSSLLVFVGASGIAVRAIAPHLKDKQTDPAVISIDIEGKYIIPLLSGHIGGGNEIARLLATSMGAQAIITTATDLQGVLAVDQWAAKQGLHINDINAAKIISSHLLEGRVVGIHSDFEIAGPLPSLFSSQGTYETGICITLNANRKPYQTTLNLIPPIIFMGIGCQRGITMDAIEELYLKVIAKEGISEKAIVAVGTIDLKKRETGLVQFAAKYNFPLTFFSAPQLRGVKGKFTSSSFVKEITGVDNVCERAAVLLSGRGKLIVHKNTDQGVAIALAQKHWQVVFEEREEEET